MMMDERERRAFLNQPLPPTPPHLLKPTKVRIIKAFMVGRRAAQPGELVTLDWATARDMIALHKAELITEPVDG